MRGNSFLLSFLFSSFGGRLSVTCVEFVHWLCYQISLNSIHMLSILFYYQVFVISYILHLFTLVVIEIKDARNMFEVIVFNGSNRP